MRAGAPLGRETSDVCCHGCWEVLDRSRVEYWGLFWDVSCGEEETHREIRASCKHLKGCHIQESYSLGKLERERF